MNRMPKVIKHLIILNVIMYLAAMVNEKLMLDLFAMHFPLNPEFRWWQVITHMFMHGGLMHILFNMYALWAFGTPLVYHLGKKRFLWFYFLSGLGALALFTGVEYYHFQQYLNAIEQSGVPKKIVLEILYSPDPYAALQSVPTLLHNSVFVTYFTKILQIFNSPMLGASGAIYGVLVGFAFFYPRAKLMLIFLPYPMEARYFIPLLILLDIFFGFTNVLHLPIAHFAHVGGALTGLFLMWIWRHKQNEYYF